jgi:hypothetical protein
MTCRAEGFADGEHNPQISLISQMGNAGSALEMGVELALE